MHFQYTYRSAVRRWPVRLLARAFYGQTDALIGNCPMLGQERRRDRHAGGALPLGVNWIDQTVFLPLDTARTIS